MKNCFKTGDKFKGLINGEILTVLKVEKGSVFYECRGKKYNAPVETFKRCQIERV